MVGLLASMVIGHAISNLPARANRVAFYNAERRIKKGWTKAQVKALLGPPDDVVGNSDPGPLSYTGREFWHYGTNGHLGLATLGSVTFQEGRVLFDQPGDRPAPLSVIGDAELAKHLRFLYRPPTMFPDEEDPLYLIRAANDLRPLGRDKALAVLTELARLEGAPDIALFWVARVAFTHPAPPGYFPVPKLGYFNPRLPEDLRSWPDFPLIEVKDVPYSTFEQIEVMAGTERFFDYAVRDGHNWTLRREPLRPPDDPFDWLEKAIMQKSLRTRSPITAAVDDSFLNQTLALVRTAYRPQQRFAPGTDEIHAKEFHAAFKAAGGHWDAKLQTYVPRNGRPLPDHRSYRTMVSCGFEQVDRMPIKLTMQRMNGGQVWTTVEAQYLHPFKLSVPVLKVVDVDSGEQLFWWPVAFSSWRFASPEAAQAKGRLSPAGNAGMFDPHTGASDYIWQDSRRLKAKPGHRLRAELDYEGKRFLGPVMRP